MSNFSCLPFKQIPAAVALYSAVFATGAIANTPQIFGLHEKVSLQELDVELATGLATFARYVDRGATWATVSLPEAAEADEERNTTQVATFRLGGE